MSSLRSPHPRLFRYRSAVVLAAALVAALVWTGCRDQPQDLTGPAAQTPAFSAAAAPGQSQDRFDAAMRAQQRHTAELMRRPDVVGTAIGLGTNGEPAVVILARRKGVAGLPASVDRIPVRVVVTGEIRALQEQASPKKKPPCAPGCGGGGGGGGGGGNKIDPTRWQPRPVPIGVSTGNIGECSSGTIGARVTDREGVYALSNNHVYALENVASPGSDVLQPGLYDTNCAFNEANVIGTLAEFVPIVFSTSASNTVDAAIALTTTDDVGNATPSNGYGTPSSSTEPASVGLKVQKYGRSSSLTRGTVTMINATIDVGYSSGTARFVGQIVVEAKKPFIKPGDSGSLLVTNDVKANPVGLLFAGNGSGKLAVANQIDNVLGALGKISIDGK